jgi:hypothetical protein
MYTFGEKRPAAKNRISGARKSDFYNLKNKPSLELIRDAVFDERIDFDAERWTNKNNMTVLLSNCK